MSRSKDTKSEEGQRRSIFSALRENIDDTTTLKDKLEKANKRIAKLEDKCRESDKQLVRLLDDFDRVTNTTTDNKRKSTRVTVKQEPKDTQINDEDLQDSQESDEIGAGEVLSKKPKRAKYNYATVAA